MAQAERKHTIITQSLVKERFHYNPETGILTRRIAAPRGPVGSAVGTPTSHGHLICRVKYRICYVHRLIWLYMTGEWPQQDIDHANGIPSDNRWNNLRVATREQNAQNRAPGRNNTSGHVGVHWFKQYGCWRAHIRANGKEHFLGHFDDKNAAIKVRLEAERRLFGNFARKGL